jgi:lipoprotein LpqH
MRMAKSLIAMVPVVLLACGLVACSSPAPSTVARGELPAGIADVTIAGADAGRSELVTCSPEGAVTTIATGTKDGGTTSTVGSDGGLAAKSVVLRNVGGFSGSYWEGLGDAPEVAMKGRTYVITGTAMGYSADNPIERKPEKFSIQVAC